MIRVSGIPVPLDFDFGKLRQLCVGKLGIPERYISSVSLSKKSVDARKKSDVHFIISVDIACSEESSLLKKLKNAVLINEEKYSVPAVTCKKRPVIIGFGPAGMFAALVLAMAGAEPIVLERGDDVDSRVKKVEEFRNGGRLDPESNVQFGEGGAGTFSDGKLTTGIKNKRIPVILRYLAEFGAPGEITYLAKPHIGTDKLRETVKNLRKRVISLGGEVRFGARFTGFDTENGSITAVRYIQEGEVRTIAADNVILAAGHSARDVFTMLHENNVLLTQKAFSMGVRIEHLRSDIDKAMYGRFAGHPALKAADYKLAVHLPDNRSLYTFCMCPGGYVMAAASEEGRLAVNGMSCYARDGVNSNSALLVNILPEDLGSDHPLAGMYFQRKTEELAFMAGGGDYKAPVILVGDFLENRLSQSFGKVIPTYSPGVRFAMPEEYLPDFVCSSLRLGIRQMAKKIQGFDQHDAVLTGVESRSSSPVRIERSDSLESPSVGGLFPCGEGAGYAGGIISAAVDGMLCAEAVIRKINGGSI